MKPFKVDTLLMGTNHWIVQFCHEFMKDIRVGRPVERAAEPLGFETIHK